MRGPVRLEGARHEGLSRHCRSVMGNGHGNRILGEEPERLSFQSTPGDAQTPTLTHIPAQMGENGS